MPRGKPSAETLRKRANVIKEKEEQEQATFNKQLNGFLGSMGVMMNYPLWQNSIIKSLTTKNGGGTYKKDDLLRWCQDPYGYEQELREVNQYLLNTSMHFRRLIKYFTNMLLFDYTIVPVNPQDASKKGFTDAYYKALKWTSKFNIKDEFNQIMQIVVPEDVVYCYKKVNSKQITFQKLPSSYCKITSRDGVGYRYAFNMQYFLQPLVDVAQYPEELQKYFLLMQDGQLPSYWINLSDNAIAFKLMEETAIVNPFFIPLLADALDITEFKNLLRTKTVLDNTQLIQEVIPMGKEGKNNFLIDFDTVEKMHTSTKKGVPDGISLVASPMEMKSITLNGNSESKNSMVGMGESIFYNASGTTSQVFSSDANNGIAILKSIMADEEGVVLKFYNQVTRWINNELANLDRGFSFEIIFTNTTYFNQATVIDQFSKSAQYGIGKSMYAASLGLEPRQALGMAALEKAINFDDMFTPLMNSHVMSGKDGNGATDEGGIPKKNEADLTDSAIKTISNGDNEVKKAK